MSAKGISAGIEVHDLGMRRLYVKLSTGFVLHNDDLTAEELLAIAEDIARRERKPRLGPNLELLSSPTLTP